MVERRVNIIFFIEQKKIFLMLLKYTKKSYFKVPGDTFTFMFHIPNIVEHFILFEEQSLFQCIPWKVLTILVNTKIGKR